MTRSTEEREGKEKKKLVFFIKRQYHYIEILCTLFFICLVKARGTESRVGLRIGMGRSVHPLYCNASPRHERGRGRESRFLGMAADWVVDASLPWLLNIRG